MGIDTDDVGAEGVTGENDRSGQIERMNQAMQIVRQRRSDRSRRTGALQPSPARS